jgi:hypothetical protein
MISTLAVGAAVDPGRVGSRSPLADGVDACSLLTAEEVEAVTGLDAQPGVMKETDTVGQFGCGFGTEPYEVQVAINPSLSGPAVVGLGDSGHPVEGVGDGAEWWWCEECLGTDFSSSTNHLVVASGTWYVDILFAPTTDQADEDSELHQATHLEWAIELAGLIVPRLPSPAATPPAVSGAWSAEGRSTYEGTWTLTELLDDSGSVFPDSEQVGDTAPGTLTIDCLADGATCTVTATMDGGLWAAVSADVIGAGVLRSVQEARLDNCPDGQISRDALEVRYDAAAATATRARLNEPRTCEDGPGSTLYSQDITWSFDGALVDYTAPLAEPSSAPSPSAGPSPSDSSGPPADGSGSHDGAADATVDRPFAASVPTAAQISTDPAVLLQSALLAALLVFLMPFPSQLFNSTLEAHEDDVRRWFRLDRIDSAVGRIGAFWASWAGVVTFTLLATLLYAFLDPGFGFDVGSLATFLGMLLGIVLVTAAFSVPLLLAHRRHGDPPTVKVVPISLLIGVACVLVTRLTGFQPGYLYGLLIGLAFARELSAAEEGRATAIGAGLMLAIAIACWLALGVLPTDDAFGLVVLRTALAALMVAGLEGVVFGLLPMRFLPGEPLYAWNRVAWAALLGIGAFAFFHLLINPASGYLSDTSRTPLLTVVALLVGFSAVSVAFWAWFRFRRAPEAQVEEAG